MFLCKSIEKYLFGLVSIDFSSESIRFYSFRSQGSFRSFLFKQIRGLEGCGGIRPFAMQNDRRPRSATPQNTPLTPKSGDGPVKSHRRKSRMLHIRVTPDEEDRAIEAARLLSMRLGTWSRFAMMHVAGAPTREEYEALGVDAIINRLDRVGNNLNQLARAANRGGIAMSNADRLMLHRFAGTTLLRRGICFWPGARQ